MNAADRKAYRADEKDNDFLSAEQRRRIFYNTMADDPTPTTSNTSSTTQRKSRLGVRKFIKSQLFVIIFAIMHAIFSVYIRVRKSWNVVCYQVSSVIYYHHATPQYIQKDVMALPKLPKHLSAVLRSEHQRITTDLDRLIDEAAELATWSACADIPMLSVYEKTGILKKHMPRVYEATLQKLVFYFGSEHPNLSVSSPHKETYSSPVTSGKRSHLRLHLISSQDGRESMVDLTRTLAEMSQKGKISPQDISLELVDAELSEGIMSEPDLLILFTPHVELAGYPPWQIRLTEIFCLKDNETFGYQVFLRALRNFAGAQMRKGK